MDSDEMAVKIYSVSADVSPLGLPALSSKNIAQWKRDEFSATPDLGSLGIFN